VKENIILLNFSYHSFQRELLLIFPCIIGSDVSLKWSINIQPEVSVPQKMGSSQRSRSETEEPAVAIEIR